VRRYDPTRKELAINQGLRPVSSGSLLRDRRAHGIAAILAVAFVVVWWPFLSIVPADFDEGWFILESRSILRGLHPFVDFAHHDTSLHLYLLALCAKVFGQTFVGYRTLSLLGIAGSSFLVFCLVRPTMGAVPALVAQMLFLSFPGQLRALVVVPEPPMVFFLLLGIYLLFQRNTRASAWASGIALAVAIMLKPLCLVAVAGAAMSLGVARQWRRLGDLAASGLVGAAAGIAWALYVSDGIFGDVLRLQVLRYATRNKGIWSTNSGVVEMMRAAGIQTPFQLAMSAAREFYHFPETYLSASLLVLSIGGMVAWLRGAARSNTALAAFAVLWPVSFLLVNFAMVDFLSPRYFVPYLAFSAFLLAGIAGVVQRRVGAMLTLSVAAIVCGILVSQLVSIVREHDAWYVKRAESIARRYPEVVSFSPMFFAATGTEPGCGFENPMLTYGRFGEQFLVAPRLRRFAFSDERIIECLKQNPRLMLLVDIGFYLFTRPGSRLHQYLDGEGSTHRLFFSDEDETQWNLPIPWLGMFR
jgi:4-amino-4-deoxy-L-arabinose transferase-like glycosyltransferase